MDLLCHVARIYEKNDQKWIDIQNTLLPNSKPESLPLIDLFNEHPELVEQLPKEQLQCLLLLANNETIPIIEKEVTPRYFYLYCTLLLLHFCFLCAANIMSVKVMHVFGIDIIAGALCFPLTYSIAAMIVELFGLRLARFAIILSMLGNTLLVLCLQLAIHVPSADHWTNQAAFESVLSMSSGVFIGSMTALLVGEFLCSALVIKLKNKMPKLTLYARILVSSILGILVDSSIFLICIHYNAINQFNFINMLSNVLFHKFSYEIISSFVICQLIKTLRKRYPDLQYQPFSSKFSDKRK